MDAIRKQKLTDAGIDVDDAMERLMGNEKLLDRFLGKFTADESYGKLVSAIAADARDDALNASHSLKGVCGNLSMTVLFGLLDRQVAAMRADDWENAVSLMAEITPAYETIVAAIALEA